ncbi:hypothetical protein FBU59_002098 [Linderina macrospora]|uniref:Uncharacterized protein n=1 Tax=Linderina macrospora TaxID=4868 RepID=A0ACC1JBY6_9FUNG|nr:hypothetical protein FBU59_002098 [Linderina macrospora]
MNAVTTEHIELPSGMFTCYFVRHGERIDHIDDQWTKTATTPYDPPLTSDGHRQAYKTGNLIYDLEIEAGCALPNPKDIISQTSYYVVTSPFLRCVQTSDGLFRGFSARSKSVQWNVAVEPGLSELMNDQYFDEQVPSTIIDKRRSEIKAGGICSGMRYATEYVEASQSLPTYPENFQDMMARFVSALDRTTTYFTNETFKEDLRSFGPPRRRVAVFVTHGAGINSLIWATTSKYGRNDADYCSLTRAKLAARRDSRPLADFGTSRISSFMWNVDYRAYNKHLAIL